MKKLCYLLLRLFGWKTDTEIPDVKKAVMCVAPHTSNWDFIIGELFYTSLGGKASFLIKEEWLKPLGTITRREAEIEIKKYIQWYNTERIQKNLGYLFTRVYK